MCETQQCIKESSLLNIPKPLRRDKEDEGGAKRF
jgi:hypothetical protein